MIKEFFIKQAIKHGAKNLPKDQQDALVAAVEKNPELFNKIAKEVEELKKKGKPEMYAMLDVMKKYQKELQTLFNS
jgi:glucosamine 6-phosphate synthetase-like amidotransferase/phosphosugar isomerase protein